MAGGEGSGRVEEGVVGREGKKGEGRGRGRKREREDEREGGREREGERGGRAVRRECQSADCNVPTMFIDAQLPTRGDNAIGSLTSKTKRNSYQIHNYRK